MRKYIAITDRRGTQATSSSLEHLVAWARGYCRSQFLVYEITRGDNRRLVGGTRRK